MELSPKKQERKQGKESKKKGKVKREREQPRKIDKAFSTYEAMVHPRARANANANSRKIGFLREQSKAEEDLPYLCVMSENKKKIQMGIMEKRLERMERRTPPLPDPPAIHYQ
ncbi:unnamed protein product [Sphagnum balticum]